MGCQLSKNKPNNSVKVNVSSPIFFTKHKDRSHLESYLKISLPQRFSNSSI